jgi:hypothetical protein
MINQDDYKDIQWWYDLFDSPVAAFDCGTLCATYNPNNKPFCCDICHAVPFAYVREWEYLRSQTNLWHLWKGDECIGQPEDPSNLQSETPDSMSLLACLGPERCQRQFRTICCRQFPFFPYINSERKFLGLAYNWDFEDTCWVISHMDQVREEFKAEFIRFYDHFFTHNPGEIEVYIKKSSQMRLDFISQKRSITLMHRDGNYYLLRPINERLRQVEPNELPRFGVYQQTG